MPKRPPKKGSEVPEWVVTYGDLMSLLLCFFILLAAFSELKQPKEYQKVIDSIKEALGIDGGAGQVDIEALLANAPIAIDEMIVPRTDPEMQRSLDDDDNVEGRNRRVSAVHDKQRWVTGGSVRFAPGSAELTPDARLMLDREVIPRVRDIRQKVLVRGHSYGITDMTPQRDLDQLSFDRARAIKTYLVEVGKVNPLNLVLVGAGDTEPLVVPHRPTDSADVNRRVEIMVTEVTVDELHPDPEGTGRGRE